MSRAVLKHIIGRQPEARALVAALADALGATVAVEDGDGRLLHGAPLFNGATTRYPVTHLDASVGWVSGPAEARVVATLLDHLVAKEVERKALGAEVLHLYREINLIYSFSEKLAALLDLERVAHLTLQEARHLIVATDGVLMLLDEDTGTLTTTASFGDEMPQLKGFVRGTGIVGAIAASGVGEIVNDVDADPRRVTAHTMLKALIAAPLKVGERVIGVIALASTLKMAYTAAELKLLNTLALQTATAIENARLFERTILAGQERERLLALHRTTEIARAKLESELDLAARIQSNLFPSTFPAHVGYELAARNRPARQCGGDYYDVLTVPGSDGDGRLVLCVADVAGKGLPAALVMSNMQATLRALLGRTASLTELAAQADELLYGSTSPEKYVTAALAELTLATGAVTYVGAGHLDNLILRRGGTPTTLASTGTPLGLLPPGLPFGAGQFTLDAGDHLVLFSDGVTEAQNSADEEFGEARLVDVLSQAVAQGAPPAAIIEHVFDAIDRFAGGAPQFDDITMLVVNRAAGGTDGVF